MMISPGHAPLKRAPIEVVTSPFVRFAQMEAASGILLLIAAAAALFWANSPLAHSYHALWNTHLSISAGSLSLSLTGHDWVNDGLMAIFFFLVGLEIKREVLIGELSSFKQAAFPFIAALGGSLLPALIFFGFNPHGHASRGWGIPMATDIAFALGVLALLGNRVPGALKIFVAALAIVDDIFAVLVIAVFYTGHISLVAFGLGLAAVGVAFAANRLGVRNPAIYAIIGVFAWLAVLHSGVHATVAGILMAFTIPLKEQSQQVESPLQRMEHALEPWVAFFIMPVFALSNAGVHVLGKFRSTFTQPIALGVLLGLLLGKPAGIMLFSWLSTLTRLASRPAAVSWKQLFGASWLCGIGFTMSLFIAGLAFTEPDILDISKIAILTASIAAGAIGSALLKGQGSGIRDQ